MLQFTVSQRVRHDLVTEQQQLIYNVVLVSDTHAHIYICTYIYIYMYMYMYIYVCVCVLFWVLFPCSYYRILNIVPPFAVQ